ncbi:rhomboid protease GluP [Mucilaginibacter sp. OK268]|uniref:hypothetical protein n=1 Tax=Mucilaginibacter sp. OK268 TaxID=1881048 RepID=UPI00088A60C7|nr:hypothetical protein [Mucilaginibacter sp. OK268]SDP27653.1 rhomboid protease GluP [Mucilaginibacter sp. OK268]
MTKDIYNRSIETCEVQLEGFWVKSAHFGIVGYLIFMPSVMLFLHLIYFFQNKPDSFRDGEIWIIVIPLFLSVIAYWIQKRRLKFRVIKTKLNHSQLKALLIEVAKKLKWEPVSTTKDIYVARTNPGFFSGSWGEQITVLFYQDSVFVNSICDPNKRPSVVSWGRNRENENTLIDKINEVESNL